MILYLDTSALVKLYVKKLGSQAVRALFRKGSRRFREGAPLCNPAGDRCPRDEGKTHRDHELLH